MTEGKRIGRIVDGRFVSDDEGPTEELTPETGFVDPGAMIERRADWQLRDDGHLEVEDEHGRRSETVEPVVEAEVARRMAERDRAAAERRVDEQLEHLEHVIASIEPGELTWAHVTRLTEVNERVLELYKAGLIALVGGQSG